MLLIGDVHGAVKSYLWTVTKMQISGEGVLSESKAPAEVREQAKEAAGVRTAECSLQIGDFGFGFKNEKGWISEQLPEMPAHKFMRGNHDDPAACRSHPNYLGDVGYIPEMDMFYLGGGFSIDYARRTPGVTWWRDEELPYDDLTKAYELYADSKPRIVVTHECPTEAKDFALGPRPPYGNIKYSSRTERALQMMFATHQPDEWVFGHYHRKAEQVIDGTKFVVLNELSKGATKECVYEIPGLQWPDRLVSRAE